MIEAIRAVVGAVRLAASDARRSWTDRSTAALVAFLIAAAGPLVISNAAREAAVAARLYLALAAVALNVAVGLGGLPSLGQGAFVGIGSFAGSLLLVRAGWGIPTAVLVAAVAAGLAGLVVGIAAVRLRGPFVAVVTWVVSWVVGLTLGAFTGVFGGSQGLALPSAPVSLPLAGGRFRMTAGVHYETALVLVALALWAFARLARSPVGVELAAVRTSAPAARTLGVDVRRLQIQAFVASATVGGVAGALSAHLAGVADPTAYGPLLSVELFVAVLLGGVGRTYGPLIGTAILAAIPTVAARLGSAAGLGPERFEPVLASVLLLAAVVIGPGGLTSAVGRRRQRRRPPVEPAQDVDLGSPPMRQRVGEPALSVSSLRKRFGGVAAVDGVSVTVRGGAIHAVIGPNGSGKTTLLRLLSGTLAPDDGRLAVGGADLTTADVRARVRAGVVRTIARTTVFDQLTAAQHVTVGMATRRRSTGFVRTLAGTPLSRAEAAALDRRARELLAVAGLEGSADLDAGALTGAEQRLLMVLTACAADPAVLLLDEPSTGLSGADADRMAALLQAIRATGVTLLVVEHNLQLVRRLADPVTVLDAGRVIGEGSPAAVASDPAVQDAYLGPGAADLLAGPATEYRVAARAGGGWAVERTGATRPSSRHDTKPAAVRRARDLAGRHAPARVVVQRKDGSVEREFGVERGS